MYDFIILLQVNKGLNMSDEKALEMDSAAEMAQAQSLLQRMLGLDRMTTSIQSMLASEETTRSFGKALESAIRNVLSDPEANSEASKMLGEAIYGIVKRIGDDNASFDRFRELLLGIVQDSSMKGVLSEGVFHGMKRLSSDGEFHKSMSLILTSVIASQEVQNVVSNAVNSLSKNLTGFLVGEAFRTEIENAMMSAMGGLQENIHLAISEGFDKMRGVRLRGLIEIGEHVDEKSNEG